VDHCHEKSNIPAGYHGFKKYMKEECGIIMEDDANSTNTETSELNNNTNDDNDLFSKKNLGKLIFNLYYIYIKTIQVKIENHFRARRLIRQLTSDPHAIALRFVIGIRLTIIGIIDPRRCY